MKIFIVNCCGYKDYVVMYPGTMDELKADFSAGGAQRVMQAGKTRRLSHEGFLREADAWMLHSRRAAEARIEMDDHDEEGDHIDRLTVRGDEMHRLIYQPHTRISFSQILEE